MIPLPVRAAAMSLLLAALPTACASSPAPSTPARHFDIVNGTRHSVQAIAVAAADSPDFGNVALTAPLGGGHQWTTVALPAGPCLRDIRVRFRDGRAWLYRGIDVCRHQRLRMTVRDVLPAR